MVQGNVRLLPAMVCGGILAATAVGMGVSGAGAAPNPPGNNGTVKIDGVPFDDPDHPDNEPHVGCEFQVDFYGYDEGDLDASTTFEAIPPTVGEDTLLVHEDIDIGEDAAGGAVDLDATVTYDLTNALVAIDPHPIQGWHVKLTVHAEGSQGADTKHKVFWVEGCGETPPTTSPPTTKPGETTTTTKPDGPGGGHGSTTTSAPPLVTPPPAGPITPGGPIIFAG